MVQSTYIHACLTPRSILISAVGKANVSISEKTAAIRRGYSSEWRSRSLLLKTIIVISLSETVN